jgi:hypothetical protein
MFFDTFNTIGNAHIMCGFLILGGNLYLTEKAEYSYRFRVKDFIANIVIKSLIMPFFGIIYVYGAAQYTTDRVVLFNAYIQWILPTSIDVLAISQAKEVATKDFAIAMTIQWLILVCFSNFINLPAFLKAIALI